MAAFCALPASVVIISLAIFSSGVGFAFPIDVWPYPTFVDWPYPQAIRLSPGFTISTSGHRYLDSAIRRYHKQILNDKYSPLIPPRLNLTSSPSLRHLGITTSDADAPLAHGVDESYNLSIPCTGEAAVLSAATAWGAMRGLETFSQLVYSMKPRRVACGIYISDAPLFRHRGILLDTSRNFYELEDLLRLIDAMSFNKLNVFHWHITDSQSFPLIVPSAEELSAEGAYTPEMKYSPENVATLIQYASERGVRVVPEIDMPAHSSSWAKAYPQIVTCANEFWWPAGANWSERYASEPGAGQLNPLIPETYQVVLKVIRGVVSMFPDEFYHAGGDEVVPNCWKIDPAIQNFLNKNSTLSQVLELFVNSTLPTILSLNRSVIYWEDMILDDEIRVNPSLLPPENVVVQTWNNGATNTKRIVGMGYRVIVSSSEYYYLDCGHGGWVGNDSQYDQPSQGTGGGSWCAPFKTWQTIYDYDITQGLTVTEAKLVLGGEVALWSEQADSTVMDSRIWPRAAALGESLWSGNRDKQGRKRYANATDRLNEWRHRMVKRGIAAEPIQPLWCLMNPGMCNTVNSSE